MVGIVLLFTALMPISYALVCPEDICTRLMCAPIDRECKGGSLVPGGGYCGCCAACIPNIKEGESCQQTFLQGSVSGRCEIGTACDTKTLTCVSNKTRSAGLCEERNSGSLLGQQTFRCNKDGSFAAVQCQGSVCYCADTEGRQIAGYSVNIGASADMNCRCALDKQAYMKSGLLGRQFSCKPNGNYSPYACQGSVCYCTDENGVMKGTHSVNIGQVASLNCEQ